jgi:hypothetical protein
VAGKISFSATAGAVYRIQVENPGGDGADPFAPGVFTMHFTMA